MKLRLIYLALMIICSFSLILGVDNNARDSLNRPNETIESVSNDTLQFVLKNGYIIHWIKSERDVLHDLDSKYTQINRRKKIRIPSMYEQIGDTTNLHIYVPYKTTGPLKMGDLVFILLMHDIDAPRFAILYGYSLHWFDTTSPIMGDGLLDWLEEDRENIVKKLCKRYKDDPDIYPRLYNTHTEEDYY